VLREWCKEVVNGNLEGGEANSGIGVAKKHLKLSDFENGKFGG